MHRAHEAFSLKHSKCSCGRSPGRNLKNLIIENSNVSRSPCPGRLPPEAPHRSFPDNNPGPVAAQHRSRGFNCLVHSRHLALVQLEVGNLLRFRFRPVSPFSTAFLKSSFGTASVLAEHAIQGVALRKESRLE